MRLPLGGFHHIGITVSDVDASEAWYARVLGFERLVVEPHNGADGYALLMHRPGGHLHIGLDNHKANEGESFAEHRTGHLFSGHAAVRHRTSDRVSSVVGVGRVLSSQLVGVSSSDPVTYLLVVSALTIAAALACGLPARRAARRDPAAVLRFE
ncbi:MAG TPA: VOC family protein [Bryobacteraceae bacterium]